MDSITRRKVLLTSFLGLTLLVLLILAAGLQDLEFRPGKSLNLIAWLFAGLAQENQEEPLDVFDVSTRTSFMPEIGDVMMKSLIAVFWLLLITSIISFFTSPQFRRQVLRMVAMIIPFMILLPQIAKNMDEPPPLEGVEAAADLSIGQGNFPEAPPFIQNPPDWIFWIVNGFLLFVILGAIILLWRRFRPQSDAQAVVVKEVKRALSNLDSGLGMKDVVLACYAQMCQGLQESQKIKRHKAMTPREFEVHLSKAGIASRHIDQLTRLFEGVRYGSIPTDKAAEDEAKQCLNAILEVYGD